MSIYRIEEYKTAAYTLAPDWTRQPLPTLYAVTKDDTPVDGHIYTDDRAAEHARACLDYADAGSRGVQSHSTLGGYPLVALAGDDSVICAVCAHNDRQRYIPTAGTPLSSFERKKALQGLYVHWEGRPIHCDQCHRDIPSAYGPTPDEEAEDAAELAREEAHR